MKPTAVRVALSRARKKIREQLTKNHNYGVS
jgi:RNA polymerase sigma-70 factor (ECF subfamily)